MLIDFPSRKRLLAYHLSLNGGVRMDKGDWLRNRLVNQDDVFREVVKDSFGRRPLLVHTFFDVDQLIKLGKEVFDTSVLDTEAIRREERKWDSSSTRLHVLVYDVENRGQRRVHVVWLVDNEGKLWKSEGATSEMVLDKRRPVLTRKVRCPRALACFWPQGSESHLQPIRGQTPIPLRILFDDIVNDKRKGIDMMLRQDLESADVPPPVILPPVIVPAPIPIPRVLNVDDGTTSSDDEGVTDSE